MHQEKYCLAMTLGLCDLGQVAPLSTVTTSQLSEQLVQDQLAYAICGAAFEMGSLGPRSLWDGNR